MTAYEIKVSLQWLSEIRGRLVASLGTFKSRLSLIVWVNVVLNRTVVVDSD